MSLLKKIGYGAQHPDVAWRLGKLVAKNKLIELSQPFMNGKAPLPSLVSLEPSNRCNLECQICGRWAMGKNSLVAQEMDFSYYEALLDEIAFFKPFISITGGEPTLYPHILELIWKIKEKRLSVSMVTNGLLLKEMGRELVEAGIDVIHISLDGVPAIHDLVRRRKGAFERAKEGLEAIAFWKAKKHCAKPFLQVIYVITEKSYETIPEFLQVCASLPIQSVRIQHLWFATVAMLRSHNISVPEALQIKRSEKVIASAIKEVRWEKIDPEKLSAILKQEKEKNHPFSLTVFPDLAKEQIKTYYAEPGLALENHCIDSYVHAVITSNGDVSPCLDYVAGNIKEKSFLEIWNGEAYRFFRGALKKAGGHFPYCTRCCGIFSHKGIP